VLPKSSVELYMLSFSGHGKLFSTTFSFVLLSKLSAEYRLLTFLILMDFASAIKG
jgi:hypothetical protein